MASAYYDPASARAAVRAAWAQLARPSDDTVSASPGVLSLLRALHFNERVRTTQDGVDTRETVVRTSTTDALFCLRELGFTDDDVKRDRRVSRAAFEAWFVAQVAGDYGHTRNRLLVKPVTGKSRLSSYDLPPHEFSFGARSGAHADVKAVISFAYSASAGVPDPPSGRDAVGDRVYGAPSGKPVDIRQLLHNQFGGREDAEPVYADVSGSKKFTLGALPPQRGTVASSLRTAANRARAVQLGETALGGSTGRPGTAPASPAAGWKMARFRDVAPRVQLDGSPGRFVTGH
jgi:hypothetical protein